MIVSPPLIGSGESAMLVNVGAVLNSQLVKLPELVELVPTALMAVALVLLESLTSR